ncbi:NepR family anti-sigma factor [Propylenella binzhouense]|uniref:Anti-sigma factor NepR domain-containing protein n=1 Tax=Propylenella binzhouense TaxID=2555902 RepID=A0A964WTB5_9HYPH|nr:NepR family anti-sigma factor [Propylenella binzhouense]MYZ47781.1 hypothetical protein [Propylenella binzhouense]
MDDTMTTTHGAMPRLEYDSMTGNEERDMKAAPKKIGRGASSDEAQIDPRIQTEIGKHLRAMYDDVINEPVPKHLLDLLTKLEQSRKG